MIWPFKKKNKKPENPPEIPDESTSAVTEVTKWLNLSVVHTVGIDGEFYEACVKNRMSGINPRWESLSPRFSSELDAYYYIKCFLMPHSNLGKRRIVFLESLKRNARRNRVESLFYYVRDMMDYFERCLVKNREVVEVQFMSQMDDMGDEYFNCLYGVESEIFHNDQSKFSFTMTNTCNEWPGDGMEEIKDSKSGDGRCYVNVGSNHSSPLKVFFRFNLMDVDVEHVPSFKSE